MSKPLSKGTISLLTDAISTATVLGIDKMVVDSHSLRGESQDNGTLMLFPFPQDTELEFGAMAVGRIAVLKSRLGLLEKDTSIVPEYKVRDSGEKFVFRLMLKKGRSTIDFKCFDPSQIRAPKGFNDPEFFTFTITYDDIEFILKSKSAMQADNVMFTCKDGDKVNFAISSKEGDSLVHELESVLDTKTDATTFTATFKAKILFPVLKEVQKDAKDEPIEITLTRRNVMKIDVHGIKSCIFPEV